MPLPRIIHCLLLLLAFSLTGCGVDTQGRQNPGGIIAVVVCVGVLTLLVVATPIGIVLLARRSKNASATTHSVVTPRTSAPGIFVSYRRTDSQDVAGRIYDVLVNRFQKNSVFKDVDSIPLGKDFRKVLQKAVKRAEVLIVIIGPRWSQTKNAEGKRRLDDPNDFVRIEIETALAEGIAVIPVMVSNARMVSAADLPESLKQLAFQNGLPVRPDPDFHRDMERLVTALNNLVPDAEKRKLEEPLPQDAPSGRGLGFWLGSCAIAVGIVVVVLLVLGVVLAVASFLLMR